MEIILTIFLLVVLFKAAGFVLRLCGKILGAIFSLAGYILLGAILVWVFGFAIIALPILIIAGILSICALIAAA